MRYWSNNPELYDEIATNALPEPWKTQVLNDEIELSDVPDKILYKARLEGERNYWASLSDRAYDEKKARRRGKK